MKRKLTVLLIMVVCFALIIKLNIEVFQEYPGLLWVTIPVSILGIINAPYKKYL